MKITDILPSFSIILFLGITVFAETHIIEDRQTFTIYDSKNSRYTIHRRIMVEDKKGRGLGEIILREDGYSKIKNVKGYILSPGLKKLSSLSKKDIRKWTGDPRTVFYSDASYYIFNLEYPNYPYIIDYSYTIDYSSLFFFPDWFPQDYFPVDLASFTIICPPDIRYNMCILGEIPAPVVSEKENSRSWTLKDIPKIVDEQSMPPESRDSMGILFATDEFIIDDVQGSNTSWDAFAKFYATLARDQYTGDFKLLDELSFNNCQNTSDTVAVIYKFVQDNTHYIGMEEGIHSYKPHLAQQTLDNKYGDCKDLTTLLVAILGHYNIEAYPVLVKTRNIGLITRDFPASQFNHAICCIPNNGDTLWIDGTSDYTTIHDLPGSDEGIFALIIKNDHAIITRTPLSNSDENMILFEADIDIDEFGNAHVTGSLTGYGNDNQLLKASLRDLNAKDQRKKIVQWLDNFLPELKLISYDIWKLENNTEPINITFQCLGKGYANVNASRMFVVPGFFRRLAFSGESISERRCPVYHTHPYTKIDKITFRFPHNWVAESIPDSIRNVLPFCEYHSYVVMKDDQYFYERRYSIKNRLIPLNAYPDYFRFRKQVANSDNTAWVFKKQSTQ